MSSIWSWAIADLYDPENMPTNFHEAHDTPKESLRDSAIAQLGDRNDEMLARIYIGRRFKNDTVRKRVPAGKKAGKPL